MTAKGGRLRLVIYKDAAADDNVPMMVRDDRGV